jgi:HK97 family phage major capsid protein
MPITLRELDRIHELYREAVEASRDESADDASRSRALDDAVSLRAQLDQGLLEAQRDREVDEARAALGGLRGCSTRTAHDDAQLRTLIEPVDPERGLVHRVTVPLSFRDEYPLAVGDSTHSHAASLAPATLSQQIVYSLVDESAVLAAGPTVFSTAAGNDLTVPTLATDATADYRLEGQPATMSTPAFGTEPLKAYNLSGYIQATNEFLTDCQAGDAQAIVSRLCGRALGIKTATELAVGDGNEHIEGAFHAPTAGMTGASATSFTSDELLQLRASVTPANRRRGRWLFSDDAYSRIALLMKDGEGRYLIQPSMNAGLPDTLWGQSLLVDAYGPTVAASHKTVLYGDFSQAYAVRWIGNLEITASDAEGFTSWVRTYRFQVRADAGWLDASAVKALVQAAA